MIRLASLAYAASIALAAVSMPGSAAAATIVYQYVGTASFSLGTAEFTQAPITFSLTSDTDDVFLYRIEPLILRTPDTVLSFTANGSAGTFDTPYHMYSTSYGTNTLVGLSPEGGNDLIDVDGAPVSGYYLDRAIGPYTQTPPNFLNFGEPFPTSLGDLVFLDDEDASFTFSATLEADAVPEPSTWGLLLLGFASLGAVLRRRIGRVQPSSGA